MDIGAEAVEPHGRTLHPLRPTRDRWGSRSVAIRGSGIGSSSLRSPDLHATHATSLSRSSVASPGLTRRLGREWVEGAYYVGEWHFHPFAAPTPSPLDIKQIMVFAADAELRCPRPVLLVFGGDPRGVWSLSVAVVMDAGLVFPRRTRT